MNDDVLWDDFLNQLPGQPVPADEDDPMPYDGDPVDEWGGRDE